MKRVKTEEEESSGKNESGEISFQRGRELTATGATAKSAKNKRESEC